MASDWATGNMYVTSNAGTKVEVYGPVMGASGFPLTVETEGNGTVEGGSAAEPNTINCGTGGTECEHSYAEETITLEATPDTHNQFVEWENAATCENASPNAEEKCEFTITGETTVKAIFQAWPALTITPTGTGSGQVNCEVVGSGTPDEPCASSYPPGTELELTAEEGLAKRIRRLRKRDERRERLLDLALRPDHAQRRLRTRCQLQSHHPRPRSRRERRRRSQRRSHPGAGRRRRLGLRRRRHDRMRSHLQRAGHRHLGGWQRRPLALRRMGRSECLAEPGGDCEVEMSEAKTVHATFAPNTHTLKLEVSGEGEVEALEPPTPQSGEISECEAGGTTECEAVYLETDTVTLKAVPTLETQAAGWSGCTEVGADECELTVATDTTVQLTFVKNPSELKVFKGGNGAGTIKSLSPNAEIDCGSECSTVYEEGQTVQLEAEASSGSTFAGWIGCHPVVGEEEKCNLKLNGEEVDVTAVFLAVPPPAETPTLHELHWRRRKQSLWRRTVRRPRRRRDRNRR